tara:strand:- start:39742 stop:41289 length:1548 start_codon:yes stop_codon:yes gene_type:complete
MLKHCFSVKSIHSALISVYHKDGLDKLVEKLNKYGVTIYSTGGTQKFIEELGFPVVPVEELTHYPSILGGRVKTLHPKIFGGILARRDNESDVAALQEFEIPEIDLVVVDLYPFEDTVASGASEADIIEKIDIGGISLIRATAKNFTDTVIISEMSQYEDFTNLLEANSGATSLEDRSKLAKEAFAVSSHYDSKIYEWFSRDNNSLSPIRLSENDSTVLRYGENPHQKGEFIGDLNKIFNKLAGKELSFNNLLDVDAAINMLGDFKNEGATCLVIKHNNACGLATRTSVFDAWEAALAADPVSAFGGVIACNEEIDEKTAESISKLFFEVLIAPSFSPKALAILSGKKNRILLELKSYPDKALQIRSCLGAYLVQDADTVTEKAEDLKQITTKAPSEQEIQDLLFAVKLVKHTKSNAIILVSNGQLLAAGTGQTSRVDALRQAIHKAKSFGFSLKGAVMASDAFFPFPDCIEIASEEGVTAVVQPGGSIKDQLSIDACNERGMAMVSTGIRHFKH